MHSDIDQYDILDNRLPDLMFIHSEIDDLGLDPYAFRVYARLVRRAKKPKGETGQSYESVANMATGCLMSERRARQALRELEERRMVTRHERKGATTVYLLTPQTKWRASTNEQKHPKITDSEAELGRHHVPGGAAPDAGGAAPDAAKGNPLKIIPKKEEGKPKNETPPNSLPGTPLSPSQDLTLEEQINAALADSNSSESRAFLAAHGITTDQRPIWEMRKILRRLLGDQFNHPQVQTNVESWAGQHSLDDVRQAWARAVARRKRNPTGLRAVLHLVDILNGTYKPDAVDLQEAKQASETEIATRAARIPKVGQRVRLPNGEELTVTRVNELDNWLYLSDDGAPVRPEDCTVLT